MNIFKFDSPVMQFMGKVADMIILNLLTLILSIPIITFGAAYTAKYYVSMKIVRKEEGTLFKPYFKAFKDNFKQATLIWIIQLVILILLGIDWLWIYNKGFGNVNEIYMVLLALLTCFVVFITATIFPFIARFEMTVKEAYKGAGLFSFLYFIKLALIAALEVITIIASVWYASWLPAILLFGTTTSFYFMNLTLIKGFKKLEARVEKEEEEKAVEEKAEECEEAEDGDTKLGDTLVIRPDEHTVKGKIEAEKQTFKSLSFKEKVGFIRDYYLLKIVLGVLVGFFALWFVYDAFIAQKETLYSGGLLLCAVTDEGREYLTDNFFDKIATKKRKQQVNLSEDLTMTLVEGQEVKPDPSQ
ncbi:MAG: YesL family protein, partial [Lachnospiraceae bacterium]|nr:YesL family protein [Lachnospiraceae bacterium]